MDEQDESHVHGDKPAAAMPDVFPDRKELAATAFQRTRMPMVVTDAKQHDYPIVLANEAFLKLTDTVRKRFLAETVVSCRAQRHPKSPFPKFGRR